MDTCHGKTKSGTRCKRSIREGSRFCSTHSDQSQEAGDADSTGRTSQEREPVENPDRTGYRRRRPLPGPGTPACLPVLVASF